MVNATALLTLGLLGYDHLSGRQVLADSWDQWQLVRLPLSYWESLWRSRPDSGVVACLTTLPSRLPYLELTLKSLLYQSQALSKIRLHLPHFSQREQRSYELPPSLKDRPWLEICPCEDWGPASKLIPALSDCRPEQPLLVVDDDMLYPATLLEGLLTQARLWPDWVVASSGWRVPPDLIDRPTSLSDNIWQRPPAPVKSTRIQQPYRVDIVQGYSGFLTQPQFYQREALLDYASAPEAVRWVDDCWLSAHTRVPKAVCPAPRYCFERWKARGLMKAGSLGRLNRGDGDPLRRNNTIAIRHLRQHWLNFP